MFFFFCFFLWYLHQQADISAVTSPLLACFHWGPGEDGSESVAVSGGKEKYSGIILPHSTATWQPGIHSNRVVWDPH